MTIILTLAMKIIWWALPKLAGSAIDKIGQHLAAIEAANDIADPAARRQSVLDRLKGDLPVSETFLRAYVEILVILSRVGVTSGSLEVMETLVKGLDKDALQNETKRNEAIQIFLGQYQNVPESVARLLIELAVAKIRNQVA